VVSTFWSTQALLTILKDTYRPAHGRARVIEIPLLASTSSGYPFASVIQHEGRERKRITFTAHVSDWDYYDALQDDYFAATAAQFAGPDWTTATSTNAPWYVIEDLGEPSRLLADDIRFSVKLVEVSS
jgi:hypothetical protein